MIPKQEYIDALNWILGYLLRKDTTGSIEKATDNYLLVEKLRDELVKEQQNLPKITETKFKVGDKVIVMGTLHTIIERIDGSGDNACYWFDDGEGRQNFEIKEAIELDNNPIQALSEEEVSNMNQNEYERFDPKLQEEEEEEDEDEYDPDDQDYEAQNQEDEDDE